MSKVLDGDLVPGLVLAIKYRGDETWRERLLPWPVHLKGKQASWILETPNQERIDQRPSSWLESISLAGKLS